MTKDKPEVQPISSETITIPVPDYLTLRQFYKAAALQGMLSNSDFASNPSEIALHIGHFADALIAEDEQHAKESE